MMESQRKEPEFVLRGWIAVAVSLAAAIGLLISLYLLVSGGAGGIEVLGTSNFDTINVEDGSVSAPSLAFTSDPDTGLYRIGANNVGMTAGGVKAIDVNASGVSSIIISSESVSGSVHYGNSSNPSNNDRIAHGFTTTPTACTVSPTGTGTVTATVGAITSTGFAIQIGGATGVYWICGR